MSLIDLTGIPAAIAKVPGEFQPLFTLMLDRMTELETAAADRMDKLESTAAGDTKAIVTQILEGLKPVTDAVNTVALTVNATATEIQQITRRLDGAKLTLTLAPEVPADAS